MEKIKIGQKIRELREAQGLTQEELSGAANISNRALQRIETGSDDSNPTLETLSAIATALNSYVTELIAESGVSHGPPIRLTDRFAEIAEIVDSILKLGTVSPDKRRLVMALISEDPKHLKMADPAKAAHVRALLKAL